MAGEYFQGGQAMPVEVKWASLGYYSGSESNNLLGTLSKVTVCVEVRAGSAIFNVGDP